MKFGNISLSFSHKSQSNLTGASGKFGNHEHSLARARGWAYLSGSSTESLASPAEDHQQTQPPSPSVIEMEKVVAPWKQLLLSALESNSSAKNPAFLQLATVGADGRPANRTVVFRGFQETTEKIQINTDCRSRKIEDLKHCPYAEICWYFTESWEQFRINGRVDVIDGSCSDLMKLQQREKAWFASSFKSRQQYLGPHPGLPSLSEQSSPDPPAILIDHNAVGPVDAFCQLVLDPDKVDYLNLKIGERIHFTSGVNINGDKHWTSENINP